MTKYEIYANGMPFGVYEADDVQGAKDACARDAGYKSEADMEERLDRPTSLAAVEYKSSEWHKLNPNN